MKNNLQNLGPNLSRPRAEECLKKQNDELKSALQVAQDALELYDSVPTGYFTLSKDGRIVRHNLSGLKMLCKERLNLIDKMFSFFICHESRPFFDLFLIKIFITRTKEICEVKLLTKDNSKVNVQLSGIISKNSNFCLLSVVDISKRKRMEEEIRRKEEILCLFVENSPAAIAMFDKDMKYIVASRRYRLDYGLGCQRLIGRSFYEVFPEVTERWKEIHKRCLMGASERNEEETFAMRSGLLEWIKWEMIPWYNNPDEIGGVILFSEIITKEKESKLFIEQQNIELKELNITKDKFFSIIAHDLRSPFQGFLSMTQYMAAELGEFTSEEIVRIGKAMNQTAENLFNLLKNLLEWAQMQKGTISFQQKEISLNDLVKLNIASLKKRCEQKSITIMNSVSENLQVFGDERMLNSVLLNLLSNAVKFTNRGGKVSINAKAAIDNFIEICICDNGVGMDKNLVNKLFKIGEKTKRSGTDEELGTGLGLLLCKEFIEKNGGKIWVDSEEDVGSSFHFSLRLVK